MKDFSNYLNRITQNSGSCARIIDIFRSEVTMKNTISDLKLISEIDFSDLKKKHKIKKTSDLKL